MMLNVKETERECKMNANDDENRPIMGEGLEKVREKYEEAKDAEVSKIELELELLSSSAFE